MTETKKKSNYTLVGLSNAHIYINESKCNGCGLCGELCPFGLPQSKSSGKFEISDSELCVECSACKRNCPMQAIVMQEQKGCGCLWDARVRLKNNNKSCCS
jgi:ferredoxin